MKLDRHIARLKQLPEVHLDKQAILLGKHTLLAEINHRQESRTGYVLTWPEAFRFMWLRFIRKVVPAERYMIAAFLVITVTASTTFMAQAAVPGDVLWPVKLTYEKAELAFATDPAHEGRLHIKHADNRLKELTVIVAQPNTVEKSRNISQLVRRLEKDITAADQSLKLAQEEKKDTEPEVVIALAQDLSDKALEAVTVLADNHELLEADGGNIETDAQGTDVALATSTDMGLADSNESATTAPTSSSPLNEGTQETKASAATAAAKVVAEVQAINLEVSYSALKAMIEVVERYSIGVNRDEITRLMAGKITKLSAQIAPLQESIALVNDDFILHRTELRSLYGKATETLELASDMASLDNLSGAYKKTMEAKDLTARMQMLLEEVRLGNGFKPKPEPIIAPKAPSAAPILMQTIEEVSAEPVVTE